MKTRTEEVMYSIEVSSAELFGISADGSEFTHGPVPLSEAKNVIGADGDIIWRLGEKGNTPVLQWQSNNWVEYGLTKINLMSLWNHEQKPRRSQVEVLEWLSEQTARFCIVEAPTGVGKSLICTTVCNDGGGIVLTPQISLQEQYLRDFPYMDLIMSSENYKCQKSKSSSKDTDGYLSCKRGSITCKREKCLGSCPYQIAKNRFCTSTHGTSNYAYFWRFLGTPELVLDQHWIILDEAHNLEQSLIDSAVIEISEKWCSDNRFNYRKPRSFFEAIDFFISLIGEINLRCAELRRNCDLFEREADSGSLIKTIEELIPLEEFLSSASFSYNILTAPDKDGVKFYESDSFDEDALVDAGLIITRSEDKEKDGFSFKPLYAKHIWESLPDEIKNKRFLLTSATILDVDQFVKNIGWSKKDVAFYRIDSPFDRDNRKVYLKGKVSLNRGNIEQEFPGVVTEADRFIKKFWGMRGIIHSHTFKLANEFFKLSSMQDRLLLHKQGDDRNALIERFMNSERDDIILISPSMTEGLDLKGDLARFALFLKVPYPSMGDPWVKARMDQDQSWYSWQVAKTIIQGCGRVVRSKNDWGYSVMLDGGFKNFFEREQRLFPEWFLDSIRL
jgi:Rad3-related DNA helicase